MNSNEELPDDLGVGDCTLLIVAAVLKSALPASGEGSVAEDQKGMLHCMSTYLYYRVCI